MKKSGLSRVLDLLDSFADGASVLSAEEISARNGLAVATCYRYIRDLCEAGLLVKLPGGYAPGPRIIEWDRMIRENDPLLRNGHEQVRQLVQDTGLEFLLSQLYGDRVVNVHYEHNVSNEPLRLERGSVMPLFKGSTSRVILASMPARQLRRLYEANREDPDVIALGADWKSFSRTMAQVRERGYVISRGQVHKEKVGISAPLYDAQHHILGGLTLIASTQRFDALRDDAVREITDRLTQVARDISQQIALN